MVGVALLQRTRAGQTMALGGDELVSVQCCRLDHQCVLLEAVQVPVLVWVVGHPSRPLSDLTSPLLGRGQVESCVE